jgi:hypothetical protein
VNARPDLGGRDAAVLEAERHVVPGTRHDELRLGVLKHEAGIVADAELALMVAGARVEQARERLEKGALPRSGRSQ